MEKERLVMIGVKVPRQTDEQLRRLAGDTLSKSEAIRLALDAGLARLDRKGERMT